MTLILAMAFSIVVSVTVAGILCLFLSRKSSRCLGTNNSWPNETELLKRIKVLEKRIERCENYLWGTDNQTIVDSNDSQTGAIVSSTVDQQKEKKEFSKNIKKTEKKPQVHETYHESEQKYVQSEKTEYIPLTVMDRKLVVSSPSQVSYYRAWVIEGEIFYEFCSDKTAKAINNRNAIIEPFCEKDPTSIPADKATSIETTLYGFLNKDYSIKTKTLIKFV